MSTVWEDRGRVEAARREFMKHAMGEYDRTVYYPALKEIRERCAKEGHSGGKFHDNGFGWTWFYCGKCGGRYDIQGPDGQTADA
jgi:homoaconitase/3-isopropylmalate dehydratase large subunit